MGGPESGPRRAEKERESEELRLLLERMRPKLRALFARYAVPAQETEDVLQQALLAFVLKQGDVRLPEAWLLGVVRKQCLLYWRQRRRSLYEAVETGVLERLSAPATPEQERGELATDLGRLLAQLPRRCRELLRLRYLDGLTPPEVADRLGYRHSSIGKITARCMAQLVERAMRRGYASQSG